MQSLSEITMVIPTYWGAAGEKVVLDEKIVFDHPTPLDQKGTLARLIESFNVVEGIKDCSITVIPVANTPLIIDKVTEKVKNILEPYKDQYRISILDERKLSQLRENLRQKGIDEDYIDLVSIKNYASVRNACSIAGILNKSKITIFIDDDEVFTDSDFLKKVKTGVGKVINGTEIKALAGYYLQPDTYRLDESRVPNWRKPYWNNTRAMNEAFKKFIGNPPRYKKTPFVFGGNMAVQLDTLMMVPFDPMITRGEDIDFLINLKTEGIDFFLDRELSIKHLPPPSKRVEWKTLREDAIRFLYNRKKIRDFNLNTAFFDPYPGLFLKDDLEERIIGTAKLLIDEYRSQGDKNAIEECNKIIKYVKSDPFKNLDIRKWLSDLKTMWQKITPILLETEPFV